MAFIRKIKKLFSRYSLNSICLVGLSSCNKPTGTTENTGKENGHPLGSDKNKHGCISSAGQTWGQLEKKVFNKGFRLNPVEPKKGEAVISAFILFSDDQSKIELFLQKDAGNNTFILNRVNKGTYQNDHYKYDSNKSVLYIGGVEKYKGNIE